MKFISMVCAALLLLMPLNALAEGGPHEMTYIEALRLIYETSQSIDAINSDAMDSDTREILDFCQYQLSMASPGLSLIDPEAFSWLETDLFATTEEKSVYPVASYTAGPTLLENMGIAQGYQLYGKDNYTRIESSVYSADQSERLEYVRIEYATRQGTSEKLLLLTRHVSEGALTNTGRYLVYANAEGAKSLHSITLGTNLEYRIDVAEWAGGRDFTWEKELLYPRIEE